MKILKAALTTLALFALSFTATAPVLAEQLSDTETVTETKTDKEIYKNLEKSLLFGLSSDIIGVVESTLYNAVTFKVTYPEFNSMRVLEEVSKVALEGENHNLRYKAYLALTYYQNQDRFDSKQNLSAMMDTRNQDKIFFYLQDEVQADQLTSRD